MVAMTVATIDATMATSAEVVFLMKWVRLTATCLTFRRTITTPTWPEPTATSNSMALVATEVVLGTAEAEVQAVTMPDLVTSQPQGAPRDQTSWWMTSVAIRISSRDGTECFSSSWRRDFAVRFLRAIILDRLKCELMITLLKKLLSYRYCSFSFFDFTLYTFTFFMFIRILYFTHLSDANHFKFKTNLTNLQKTTEFTI